MDFVKLANTAKRLVAANGRPVTLIKLDTTEDNSAKPWRGTADPRLTPSASLGTTGVFVDPASAQRLGMVAEGSEMVRLSEQILVVAPGPGDTNDYTTFDEVQDGTEYWGITRVTSLKPGNTPLLHYIGVKR